MFELWISFPDYEEEPAVYVGDFESAEDALDYAACHFWDGIPWVEKYRA